VTTNLNNIVERQIPELFRGLWRMPRSAIVFITHDMTVAEALCDGIAVMHAGEVVERGLAEAVFADPLHPYARGLVEPRRSSTAQLTARARFPASCRPPPRARAGMTLPKFSFTHR
jgi:ABC-type dipeptide/oligopeptide/nickel transport system ATPase component